MENHFNNLFRHRPFKITELDDWLPFYQELPNANLDSCSSPISFDELNLVITNSPKHKAPGLNGLTYELFSKLKTLTKQTISNLYNNIIITTTIPNSWKSSNLILLPKKLVWTYNLNNTRPISLIDTSRKIFTKIINNRLSEAITTQNLLSPANYAGVKNQSTMEPLSIVKSKIDTAINLNKELWFASFDIAKAYDSVNLQSLHLALKHIKAPPNIIQIILNLLQNRSIQLNYTQNPINISTSNGIDQGESLAPLL
jgi:hypothetical protein